MLDSSAPTAACSRDPSAPPSPKAKPVPTPQPIALKKAALPLVSVDDHDVNRPPPKPDLDAMLPGLIGDIARAAAANSEAPIEAIAMNFMSYFSAMCGRDVYFAIGDTVHHPRLFTCHVGRTSEGRKGEALALIRRIDAALRTGATNE